MAGVTSAGYTAKTVEEIKAEIEALFLTNVDPTLDLSPETPMGQIIGIFASKLAELWELGGVAYNAFNPDDVEGRLLDAICAITGVRRKDATRSTVTCTCNLDAGTYAAHSLVANVTGDPDRTFRNKSSVTSAGGSNSVVFEATVVGPIAAPSGTLTVITTPVTGWNSVTNALDAAVGSDEETDTALRLRRERELAQAGSSTVDAIRAALLEVAGVVGVDVLENTTDTLDANGLPPHSFEVIVFDGVSPAVANADIAQIIWENKPAGVATNGSASGVAVDAIGENRTMLFSRPTVLTLYLDYTLSVNANLYPSDGDAQVKALAKALGDLILTQGQDVIALKFRAEAMKVAGVLDVTSLKLGFSASPSGTANLAVAPREIALADTSRITVTT